MSMEPIVERTRRLLEPELSGHLYGPWEVDWEHPMHAEKAGQLTGFPVWGSDGDLVALVMPSGGHYLGSEMGEFIAASPTLAAELLAAIEERDRKIATLQARLGGRGRWQDDDA